jgi:hypothetical protein
MARSASDAIVSAGKGGNAGREDRGVITMPVEDKLFNSEIKRLDSDIANSKKSQEKFETRTEKVIGELRQDVNELRQEMHQDFGELRKEMSSNFRWMIGTYITLTGIILAAFYAFSVR